MRFKKIRDLLVAKRIIKRRKILKPDMVSYNDMALVHAEKYLKRIQNPVYVSKILKFDHADPWDSTILEFFRIVTGGTLLATEYAIRHQSTVFNLGGGFHHAQIDKAVGFCLLNDIAIAIQKYRLKKKISNPLIIDLDYHQGDGTLQFYNDDSNVFTFSLNASHWITSEKENNLDINLPENCSGSAYIEILRSKLPEILKEFNPDIVYYIAGSDPYSHDTIGDLSISRQEMLDRNMYVLKQVQSEKLPLVVVAGGGYGAESWKIYYDFIRATIGKRHHDIFE
jgi:acetoin utilization deacetylase AcuC-like enzyme